jgi:hypothetical protein
MPAHAVGNGWFNTHYQWTAHRAEANVDAGFQFAYLYQIIGNANMILANIDDAEGDPQMKEMIKGQALCYRAFAHFYAVQMYATRYDWAGNNTQLGIPLRLEPSAEAIARSSVEDVYSSINGDLDNAIQLLTGNSKVPTHKSHFSAKTAHGLKARVAMAQGQWALAVQHAKQARQGVTLATAGQLMDGFHTASNPEWIWASVQQDDQTSYFYGFFAYMSFNFNSSYIRTGPRKINALLYESMAENDIRRGWWTEDSVATRAANMALVNANFTLPKYGIQKWLVRGSRAQASSSASDLVHMRASEMYLIEAEA